MQHDLPGKPKTKKIGRLTGANDPALTLGRLFLVWTWADKQSDDGVIRGVELADVDDEAGCEGFADAMIQVGWLVVDGDTISFPGFGDHNGQTAKTRAKESLKKQRQRRSKGTSRGQVSPECPQEPGQTGDTSGTIQNKTKQNSTSAAQKSPQSPPTGGGSPPSKHQPYTPDFDAWWKTYPARDGCPPGNKRAAFGEWLRLGADRDNTVRQQIHRATKALSAATTIGETKPKDAERFLRPPRGGGDPPYLGWLDAKAPTGTARGSPKTHAQRSDSYNHTEDRSWLTGETA